MTNIEIFIDMIQNKFNINDDNRKVVVFGAGQNGLAIAKVLGENRVKVDFFCDSDERKHNLNINDIKCIGMDELKKYKEESIVFVSPYYDEEIRIQLQNQGITNVVSKELIKVLKLMMFSTTKEGYFEKLPLVGHYYSLYPDINDIINREKEIFDRNNEVKDIDFNEVNQLRILNKMLGLYETLPKWININNKDNECNLRYRVGNPSFSLGDAVGLHCMLRIIKPKRVIEVGSGYSSSVMLDTNELYLENYMKLTFIEPYPINLKKILKANDKIDLHETKLQDINFKIFEQLEEGDILFIDSTHVSKVGSDVNYLLFEILPRLKKGVYIHFHDIFYPFEYPKEWIKDGIIWNELYLLRAFLQNNKNYSIEFFQNMMDNKYIAMVKDQWPYEYEIYGGSIWIKKVN